MRARGNSTDSLTPNRISPSELRIDIESCHSSSCSLEPAATTSTASRCPVAPRSPSPSHLYPGVHSGYRPSSQYLDLPVCGDVSSCPVSPSTRSSRRPSALRAAAQALQQLRKARESGGGGIVGGGRWGGGGGGGEGWTGGGGRGERRGSPIGGGRRIQLIANRSASEDRRLRGREECKKFALACYAVVCCVGAYVLFSYVAFFMNG